MRRLLLLGLLLPAGLTAESWSFSMDNDMILDSDNRYTGGLQMGWMGDDLRETPEGSFARRYTEFLGRGVELLFPGMTEGYRQTGAFQLQQVVVTPDALEKKEPVYDDVPYVGSLALSASLFLRNRSTFREFRAGAGVIGPLSGGEHVQKGIHTLLGDGTPEGWHNQLGNYPFFQVGFLRGDRQGEWAAGKGWGLQWFTSRHLEVGNVYTGVGAGTLLRGGYRLPRTYTVVSDLFNTSQSHQLAYGERSREWGAAMSLGAFANGVGYFYLYEETKRQGYRFDRPHLMITRLVSLEFYGENLRFAFEIYPVGTVGKANRDNSFGRFNVTWWFA